MTTATTVDLARLRGMNPGDAWEAYSPLGKIPPVSRPIFADPNPAWPTDLAEQVNRSEDLLEAASVAASKLDEFERANTLDRLVRLDDEATGQALLAGKEPGRSRLSKAREERERLHTDAASKVRSANALQAALKQELLDTHDERREELGQAMAEALGEADRRIREVIVDILDPMASRVVAERQLRHRAGRDLSTPPTVDGFRQSVLGGWRQAESTFREAIR